MKTGVVFLIIGMQGTGKSPTIKKMAQDSGMKNWVVYDRRKEYPIEEWCVFYRLQAFTQIMQDITDSFIVIEEATGFVSGFKDQELADILIGIEHNRNILVIVFHSLMDVPLYIQRLSRFCFIFPTNDIATYGRDKIERNRPALFKGLIRTGKKNKQGYNIPVKLDLARM